MRTTRSQAPTDPLDPGPAVAHDRGTNEQDPRLFEAILSTMPYFAFAFDRAGGLLYANRRLLDALGVGLEEVAGRTPRELGFRSRAIDSQIDEIARVIETGQPLSGEAEFDGPPTGARGVYEYAFTPILGPDGSVELVAGTARNVTERKRREEALGRSEGRHRFLLELSDALRTLAEPAEIGSVAARLLCTHVGATRAGFAEVTDDGETIAWLGQYADSVRHVEQAHPAAGNDSSLLRALRAGRPQVVRDSATDPDLTEAESAGLRAVQAAAAAYVPRVTAHHPGGLLFVHRSDAHDWSDEEIALYQAVAERTWDSMERARAGVRLRAAEDRYLALFNSIDQGFCTVEVAFDESDRPTDYRFVEVSPSFERQTGIRNGAGRWMREIASDQDDHWFEFYGRVALTGVPIRFESYSTPLDRWWTVYAFRTGPPEERRVAVLFNDITERKRAEAEREAQLERERHGRAAAEAFLAVMSHELRTPVTSIYGTSSLLVRDPDRPDRVELMADMADEAERLRRIIDDLLVLSGVDRGFLHLTPEPVLLQHAVGEVLSDIARRFATVTVHRDIPAALPPVIADTTALRQVLYNLLSNAAKYAGSDGPVTIAVVDTGPNVEVTVSDEGPGLGENPEALFGLFYRAPETASRASGTGIGLYVARELLTAMGATIEAWNRGSGGASFRFALPKEPDG